MTRKVVLVTGGARGIGASIALHFAEAGFDVAIGDLGVSADWSYELASESDAAAVLASIAAVRAQGTGETLDDTPPDGSNEGAGLAVALDVTQPESCRAAVDAVLDRYGRLDVLCNNAGLVQSGPLGSYDPDTLERLLAVNVKGIFYMSQAAEAALRESRGAIVNTASIAGKQGYANMSAYCATKFAAIGITQSLAHELAEAGIRVNALCPGIVGTAMWIEHLMRDESPDREEREAQFEARMAERIPLGHPQTPNDMGRAAVFLATEENITGISLSVAGGLEMA